MDPAEYEQVPDKLTVREFSAGKQILRELIIGQRSRGYVALYRYLPEMETVFVLAISVILPRAVQIPPPERSC